MIRSKCDRKHLRSDFSDQIDLRSDQTQTMAQTTNTMIRPFRPNSHRIRPNPDHGPDNQDCDQTVQTELTSDQTLQLNKHEIIGVAKSYAFQRKTDLSSRKSGEVKTKSKMFVEMKVFQKF